jgi:hypothetical protein
LKIKLIIQFAWLCLWASTTMFLGCQVETQNNNFTPPESGRKSDNFVKGIMHHYTIISRADSDPEYGIRVGGARISDFFFTVGATYKEDTFRVLLPDLWQLNKLIERNELPSDSLLMASLVKGEKLLEFNVSSMHSLDIVREWKSVDLIKSKGKKYFLDYYFKENGFQKVAPLSDYEAAYIIDILSDWGVLVGLDDESGFYYLRDRTIKKKNK